MADLVVDHVTKRYGNVVAVNDVSFEARSGRILGLLGPNGAGKTSIIRMITYITAPDEGEIRFKDRAVGPWSQQQMGYLPEERGLYKKLKVGEQLVYLGQLKGLSHAEAKRRTKYWLDRFDASDWHSKKTDELSKGMQQKVQFIATILPEPDLLILDEPFSGLDPINSELLKDIVLELKSAGRTILFASHRMEQVERLCEDICLISRGEIILKGPLRDVKQQFGRNTVRLRFAGSDDFVGELEQQGLIRITDRHPGDVSLRLKDNTAEARRRVLDAALANTDEVYHFELVEPPLNDIFVQVVRRQQGEEAVDPAQVQAATA